MTTRWLIGLASGSSGNGVDAALLETVNVGLDLRVRLRYVVHHPYPRDLRDMILGIGTGRPTNIKQAALLHRLLGETFAAAARQVADQASFSLHKVQCIGCPGHTVWHEPEGRFPSTLALGMAAIVAERTGVTTVSDFRARDMAAGGLGVPLTSLVDYLLFRQAHETLALVHLGGEATVVFLSAGGRSHEVIGFEAGPCNLLLDGLMRALTGGRESYDNGGKHAVQGRCIEPLLQRWLSHPYLHRRPPKSLPKQGFGEEFVLQAVQQAREMNWSLHDLLCTATHFVAHGISDAIKRWLPEVRPLQRVLLSGGGVRNGLLWHLLAQQFAGILLEKTDRAGIPCEMRNAVVFGVLAALTVDAVPANVTRATGAVGARLLGSMTPGSSSNWARCVAWMAGQTLPLVTAA
jgi:anhydro-N-acetylmuramic acid kinase